MNKKSGIFDWYFKSNLLIRVFIALLAGAIIGLLFGTNIMWLQPFGKLFVNMLKMIVMPVIVTSLIVGASSITPAELGKVGVKILAFYLLTSALAVSIGLIMGNLFDLGAGLSLGNITDAEGRALTAPKLSDTLLNIIPTNPFKSLANGSVLPIISFSIFFGISLSIIKHTGKKKIQTLAQTVLNFFEGCAEIMYVIVKGVLQYAPIGVFALIAVVFAEQGSKVVGPLVGVTFTAFLGYVLHILIVYGGILLLYKTNPFAFFKQIQPPMVTAFVTRSSSGTLPVSIETANEKLGASKISSFSLPLGATINMDGTAIYLGACALFIANAVGISLTLGQQLTIVLTAVLASIGTAGIPGAGAIMLLMVLNSVGLSMEAGSPVAAAYALILGIDALLDMGRTCVNVTGDLTCTYVVGKSEKLLVTEEPKKNR